MSPISISETIDIAKIADTLTNSSRNVQIASRRSRQTTFRDGREDMVLDTAIGIEALVGRESDALTYRMAQRAAIALSDNIPPENTYHLLKQFYNLRSKIAHGWHSGGLRVRLPLLGKRQSVAIRCVRRH